MIGPVPHAGPVPPEGRGDSADPPARRGAERPVRAAARCRGNARGRAGDARRPAFPIGAGRRDARAGAGCGPRSRGQQESAPLAHRFNQNGFFGHAGETPELAVTLAREDAGSAEPWNPAAPGGPGCGARGRMSRFRRAGVRARYRVRTRHRGWRCAPPGAGPDSAGAGPTGAAVAAPAPIEEAEAADPAAPAGTPRPSPDRRRARSALHVALRELESGLQVAAAGRGAGRSGAAPAARRDRGAARPPRAFRRPHPNQRHAATGE